MLVLIVVVVGVVVAVVVVDRLVIMALIMPFGGKAKQKVDVRVWTIDN